MDPRFYLHKILIKNMHLQFFPQQYSLWRTVTSHLLSETVHPVLYLFCAAGARVQEKRKKNSTPNLEICAWNELLYDNN